MLAMMVSPSLFSGILLVFLMAADLPLDLLVPFGFDNGCEARRVLEGGWFSFVIRFFAT